MNLKKGDFVEVPHGKGVVAGFEAFHRKPHQKAGFQAPMTETPNKTGDRVLITLDQDNYWNCLFYPNPEYYAASFSDVKLINEKTHH